MKIENGLEILRYKVSGDNNFINELFGINDEINIILQSMISKVQKKKKKIVKQLKELILKYPTIPQFKNLLSVAYSQRGNFEKAYEVNHRILEEHPDYLFGKINLANENISKEQFDKVPEILGEYMDIKSLYPLRNEFHISEIKTFFDTSIRYFIGINDIESAEQRLNILKDLNQKFNNDIFDIIQRLEESLLALKMEKVREQYLKQREKAKVVDVIPLKIADQTKEKPNFTHEIIEQLYCNSLRINHDLLKQIIELPRETLIHDLHKVIQDSIIRFDYFKNEIIWYPATHEFLMHAILILTELKSENSLNFLLDILRQDEEYLEFWFNDFLTDSLWESYFHIGFNKLDELKEFLFEPNHYTFARSLISEVVSKIAFIYPERKNEVIRWYKEVIEEIINRKDDETIIDSDLIGLMICDLVDLKAVDLSSLIEELFENELVSDEICGSYEVVIKDLYSLNYSYYRKNTIFENIYAKYDDYINSWHYYKNKSDLKPVGSDEEEFDDYENYDDDIFPKKNLPVININKKIGRNDPCPCGSGKKYKKCCMIN